MFCLQRTGKHVGLRTGGRADGLPGNHRGVAVLLRGLVLVEVPVYVPLRVSAVAVVQVKGVVILVFREWEKNGSENTTVGNSNRAWLTSLDNAEMQYLEPSHPTFSQGRELSCGGHPTTL